MNNIPEYLFDNLTKIKILNKKLPNIKNKVEKISDILKINSNRKIYQYLIKNNNEVESLINFSTENYTIVDLSKDYSFENFSQEMQYLDSIKYLPDDILTKVDRASMSYGLEVRVPLADHRIAELMMNNNLANKKFMNNKFILQNILKNYVLDDFSKKRGPNCMDKKNRLWQLSISRFSRRN